MLQSQNNTTDRSSGDRSSGERSLGELLGDLARDMSTLVRKEVQLAKTEMAEKVGETVRGSALLIVAGVLAFVAFEVLVAALVLLLAQSFSPPLAALGVGVVLLLIGGILAAIGASSLKRAGSPVPQQTIETLKDDAKWMKEQVS